MNDDTFMGSLAPEPEIEFVNDWSELEEAVRWLGSFLAVQEELRDDDDYEGFGQVFFDHLHALEIFVPRLLTQYAKLVELSFALTEGWEQYATLQAPTGLYLPDHR